MEGAEVTEMVVFICCLVLWGLYLAVYFNSPQLAGHLPGVATRRHVFVGMWRAALVTRKTWAQDLMGKADDARGAALLAVQQMRNIVVACTLLVMGMAQIMGRLVMIMVSDSNLATIDRIVSRDPMIGPASWPPAYVRVAVPFGATLVSLLCFGQAVRLAVHIGFNIRVIGVGRAMQHEDTLMQDEVVVMLQRCELYFTLGLRFLYLFIGTIFWVLGITALLVSSLTVLVLLAFSDVLVVPRQNVLPSKRGTSPSAWTAPAEHPVR